MSCRIEKCDGAVVVRKHVLCDAHYARLKRYGDPTYIIGYYSDIKDAVKARKDAERLYWTA